MKSSAKREYFYLAGYPAPCNGNFSYDELRCVRGTQDHVVAALGELPALAELCPPSGVTAQKGVPYGGRYCQPVYITEPGMSVGWIPLRQPAADRFKLRFSLALTRSDGYPRMIF